MNEDQIKTGIFAAYEGPYQARFRRWRDMVLAPVLALLVRLGITAWMITVLGIFASLAALASYRWPLYALGFLLLQLLLDGIDGPLSRYRKEASRAGEILDVAGDHIALLCTLGLCTLGGFLSGEVALVYGISYTFLIAFAYLRNLVQRPYALIVRPRLFLYLAYFLDAQRITPNATEIVGVASLPLLAGQAALGLMGLVEMLIAPKPPKTLR